MVFDGSVLTRYWEPQTSAIDTEARRSPDLCGQRVLVRLRGQQVPRRVRGLQRAAQQRRSASRGRRERVDELQHSAARHQTISTRGTVISWRKKKKELWPAFSSVYRTCLRCAITEINPNVNRL